MNSRYIIHYKSSLLDVLRRLNELASDAIVFLVNDNNQLLGTITDGDIRRGLIKGLNTTSPITEYAQNQPKTLKKNKYDITLIDEYRKSRIQIVPIIDDNNQIVEFINFRTQRWYTPLHAVIMAGGKGSRLKPLTNTTPKPLLKIGGKPIIEYNIDRLKVFGVKSISISVNYLAQQIIDTYGDGSDKGLEIDYLHESKPLGTVGALKHLKELDHDYLLIMNSDILTTIDFERMFKSFLNENADMAVATTFFV